MERELWITRRAGPPRRRRSYSTLGHEKGLPCSREDVQSVSVEDVVAITLLNWGQGFPEQRLSTILSGSRTLGDCQAGEEEAETHALRQEGMRQAWVRRKLRQERG